MTSATDQQAKTREMADAALIALERYLYLRAQFDHCDDEGRSLVFWREVQVARAFTVEAFTRLGFTEQERP